MRLVTVFIIVLIGALLLDYTRVKEQLHTSNEKLKEQTELVLTLKEFQLQSNLIREEIVLLRKEVTTKQASWSNKVREVEYEIKEEGGSNELNPNVVRLLKDYSNTTTNRD